jgi:hypothetical protein
MKIEAGKFYKTRDGHKVRIYALDGRPEFSVHGAILYDNGRDRCVWMPSGFFHSRDRDSKDIIAEWAHEPEIHWERIPDYVDAFSIDIDGGLACDDRYVFGDELGDHFAFPNWRDFIGKTFERPKT